MVWVVSGGIAPIDFEVVAGGLPAQSSRAHVAVRPAPASRTKL